MELQELRGRIDQIDDQLVKLFAQRMDVAAQIADYKKADTSCCIQVIFQNQFLT